MKRELALSFFLLSGLGCGRQERFDVVELDKNYDPRACVKGNLSRTEAEELVEIVRKKDEIDLEMSQVQIITEVQRPGGFEKLIIGPEKKFYGIRNSSESGGVCTKTR